MKIRSLAVLSFTTLAACGALAAPIPVNNFSFELPGTGKIKGWNGETGADVPGWASDSQAVDSGVESDWPGHTEGLWSGFLMQGDPSVWQLTGHAIQPGELFTLKVDARNNYTATGSALLLMTLYYDNAGARTLAASVSSPLTDSWTELSLSFDASTMPTSWGKPIGIELLNVSAPGGSWLGMDNARLDVVPEPASGALLAGGLLALAISRRRG